MPNFLKTQQSKADMGEKFENQREGFYLVISDKVRFSQIVIEISR